MRKIYLFMTVAMMALAACNREGMDVAAPAADEPGEMAKVCFEMNAAALNMPANTKANSQQYGIENLRILAFRQNAQGFMYTEDVTKTGWTYDEATGKFAGTSELPVGKYQFVAAYGLPEATNDKVTLSVPADVTGTMTASHNQDAALPAIFLGSDKNLTTYDLGLTSAANQKVTATIKRAVSRVDILFIRKDADGNEIAGANVFGQPGLATMNLKFGNINPTVNMVDGSLAEGTPMETSFEVNTGKDITIGNGEKTIYGEAKADNTPYDYEAVVEGDLITGSAHVYGPFLFPNADETTYSTLEIDLTSVANGDHTYNRKIEINNLPLSRNKVTLVKIYVPGTDVFRTNVSFDVTVNKAWEDKLEVEDTLK